METNKHLKNLTIKDLAILYIAKKDRIRDLQIDCSAIKQEAMDRVQLMDFIEEVERQEDIFWK